MRQESLDYAEMCFSVSRYDSRQARRGTWHRFTNNRPMAYPRRIVFIDLLCLCSQMPLKTTGRLAKSPESKNGLRNANRISGKRGLRKNPLLQAPVSRKPPFFCPEAPESLLYRECAWHFRSGGPSTQPAAEATPTNSCTERDLGHKTEVIWLHCQMSF